MGQCLITRKGGSIPKVGTVLKKYSGAGWNTTGNDYTLEKDYKYIVAVSSGKGYGEDANGNASVDYKGSGQLVVYSGSESGNNHCRAVAVYMNCKKGDIVYTYCQYDKKTVVIGIE